jgi:short subunit dehydrogenase
MYLYFVRFSLPKENRQVSLVGRHLRIQIESCAVSWGQDGRVRQVERLRGRVGVVTGADSAAGSDIARALASEGMSLMLIAQPGTHVRALAEELSAKHDVRCFPAALDVTDPAAVDRIVMHAEQHLGTVDLLVNTISGRLTDALLSTMEQRGRGHIINVPPAPTSAVTSDIATIVDLAGGEDPVSAVLVALATG